MIRSSAPFFSSLRSCAPFFSSLSDINVPDIAILGSKFESYGKHLSAAVFPTPAFPAKGVLHEPNYRLMVPLVFKQEKEDKALNVWCVVVTGVPFNYLSVKTLEAFVGEGNVEQDKTYRFAVQDQSKIIECRVSEVGSHFEHVNVLGAYGLSDLRLSAHFDWKSNTFTLQD
ncbi:unnamed protein product [Auanema sp. JU1783]|nr:unnamed protein product [Auanema sp. JU1783]